MKSFYYFGYVLLFLFPLIRNIKYWSFSKGFAQVIFYIISVIILFLSLNFLARCFGIAGASNIAFCSMFLLLIPAYFIPNIINSLIYDKDRIHKEFRFKAQNFIRPNRDKKNNNVVFANKNCILKLYESEYSFILYYEKMRQALYVARIGDKSDSIKIFAMLAKFFNFDTEISDITNILKGVNETIEIENIKDVETIKKIETVQNNTIVDKYLEDFEKVSINNISVAELIELPGINMGRAYKIYKYLHTNSFDTVEDFTDFAQINEEDAKKIQEIFNQDIRYIPKNL